MTRVVPRKTPESREGRPRHPVRTLRAVKSAGLPEPVRPLDVEGFAVWRRLYSAADWVAHDVDKEVVQQYCEGIDERETVRALLVQYPSNSRLRGDLRKLDEQLQRLGRDLGLGPAYRATTGLRVDATADSVLEQMRNARHGRVPGAHA